MINQVSRIPRLKRINRKRSPGFTLVEMMIIAPIVILIIGAFVGLIVNLTGEVLSSRGANLITYNIQDALNRIEEDVKLSSTFLAVNSIDVSSTKQGYGGTTTAGSTTNFTNVNKVSSGGSPASLILNSFVTSTNPLSNTSQYIYLKDQPNNCTTASVYSKNKAMSMNIVYFVDNNNTLWRRVIMPSTYTDTSTYCGSAAPWQLPTCIDGYNAGLLPFCKSSDEKLLTGVTPENFTINYFNVASSTTADTTAVNAAATDAARATAMLATPTVEVSITANQTIAGRAITKTSSIRATRLDANASGIAPDVAVTSAPNSPTPSAVVSNGHVITVTWPQVTGATSYDAQYRINGGSWTGATTGITNTNRSFVVTAGTHTDTVDVQVRSTNSFGSSSYATSSTTIPLWAPLILQNGWTDYGGSFGAAAYTKTKAGYVLLRGLVSNPGTPANEGVIGRLPSDYVPTDRLIFATTTYNNVLGRVDVQPSGDVLFNGGSRTWYSLETIRYLPASASYTRTSPTLLNSWVNYSAAPGGYAFATYAQDSTGRVVMQGLIKNGTNTNGTDIFTLPAGLAPPQTMIMTTVSSGPAVAALNLSASPSLLESRGQGSNSYLTLTMSYLPASASVTWSNLTLKNSWVNYGGSFSTAQYTKTSDNVVHLKGLVKSGVTTSGTVVGTLPAGFLPKQRIVGTASVNGAMTRLDINPNGDIYFYGSNNTFLSLDGISFVAEQ